MIVGNTLINYTSWVYDFTNRYMTALRGHKYHILPMSPTPLLISLTLLIFLLTLVENFHGSKINFIYFNYFLQFLSNLGHKEVFGKFAMDYHFNVNNIIISKIYPDFFQYSHIHIFWISTFLITLGVFFIWSSNAIVEGSTTKINFLTINKNSLSLVGKAIFEPLFHTNLVRKGFKIGFILFIISEIMFFFGFFWGFFHSSISPTIQIGAVWPPIDVEFITVKGFAIANTVILLTSGATLTVAHYAFELIPQKKSKLEEQDTNFTNSVESFTNKLNELYFELDKLLFDSAQPEIYNITLVNKLKNKQEESFPLVLPIMLFFSPLSKHFNRNFSLKDTEIKVKMYINLMLDLTLLLAILFMVFQCTEYFISPVNINTGIYGSTFYMITGLHGAHVFIGTCFLFYCRTAVTPAINITTTLKCIYIIFINIALTIVKRYIYIKKIEEDKSLEYLLKKKSKGIETIEHYGKFGIESFESAAWYWHFVDVVWIFVFGFVYVWSHLTVLGQQ